MEGDETTSMSEVSVDLSISRGVEPDRPKINCDDVKNICVFDELGNETKFGELYQKQKTIVVLVRHFLDYTCKEYVEDLAKIPAEYLQEAGVRLVVIGPAEHKFIKDFREVTGYSQEMYTDPDRVLYRALQCVEKMDHGNPKKSKHVKSGVVMGVLKSTWRAMKTPREFQGNVKQQGGAFILGPGDALEFTHQDANSTDHAPINRLLSLAGVQQVSFQRDPRVIDL